MNPRPLLAAVLGFFPLLAGPLTAAAPPQTVYLLTSFRGSGDGLHLASSPDGRYWTDLDRVFLRPTVGGKLFRDPHILRGPDGIFRMVWTTGWKDRGIGYASSPDLVNWSEQKYLPFMEKTPGAETCWAPETFYDTKAGQYIIMWTSNVAAPEEKLRAYYVTTKDFETFTEPKILFDPGFNNLDTTMFEDHGKYVIVFKEADDQKAQKWGAIHSAVADQPLGPYTLQPDPLVKDLRVEGPAIAKIEGKTLLYADFYGDHRYGLFERGSDGAWKDISKRVEFAPGQRHGSILEVPASIFTPLVDAHRLANVPRPILDGFTADPGVRVFGDTYYIYPTSDKPNWLTTDFSVWSSKNLIDWKKERMILDVTKDLKWANLRAWAPDTIARNGKYYFYFCADGKIGVGVADNPAGPFCDALDKPLLDRKADPQITTNTIDPYPFIDDDGQAYIYFGNSNRIANVFKLKPDMVTLDGGPTVITIPGFREGIVVFKRNGLYYFMWSVDDARSDNYRVGYGFAKSPLGPVEIPANNIVLQKSGLVKGTGHHSVVNVPGTDRWYVVYHRHAIPIGGGYQRETCLARMEFNPDGTIKPIDPLAPVFPPGSPGEPIKNGVGLKNP